MIEKEIVNGLKRHFKDAKGDLVCEEPQGGNAREFSYHQQFGRVESTMSLAPDKTLGEGDANILGIEVSISSFAGVSYIHVTTDYFTCDDYMHSIRYTVSCYEDGGYEIKGTLSISEDKNVINFVGDYENESWRISDSDKYSPNKEIDEAVSISLGASLGMMKAGQMHGYAGNADLIPA